MKASAFAADAGARDNPIIDATIEALRVAEPSYKGLLATSGPDVIRCEVCLGSLERLRLILSRVVAAAELQGFVLRESEVGAEFFGAGETISLRIEEAVKRIKHVLTAAEQIGDLADPDLESGRLDRLRRLMEAVNLRAIPDERGLAGWMEAVALSLEQDGSSPRTWGSLYDEVRKALPTTNALRQLGGRRILRTRGGDVHAAGGTGAAPVFVREAGPRDRDRAPLPPSAVASGLAILDGDIPLAPEVLVEFIKAGLLHRFDALQVLRSVHTLFGDKPAPKRREAILRWAFEVWRTEGSKSEKMLRAVDLHVETRNGWHPASSARFSEGWTVDGRKLSNYLAEAASQSPDCARAAEKLLASEPAWAPKPEGGGRRQWIEFLRAAGVRDGLPLLDDEDAPDSGTPYDVWDGFRKRVVPAKGRSAEWAGQCSAISVANPLTVYTRLGGLWRLPGQAEHSALPPETRHRLAELVLSLLANDEQTWLKWRIGRYERWDTEQKERIFPTPAAIFISSESWMPVEGDPERFERPGSLWASKDRRQRPPRYVDRPREKLVDSIEEDKRLAAVMFDEPVGLRDWSAADEAVRRLADLARGSNGLEARERVNFRKSYQRAWADACDGEAALPADLPVAVVTALGISAMVGDASAPPRLFVTGDPLRPESKAVMAAGHPVLELGDEDLVGSALERLGASGGFDALGIDRNQVAVLVDGEPMVPSLADPLLAVDGLEWLPEAAVLANEVLGRELERQISSASVEKRLRSVRLRQCGTISLAVSGVAVDETLPFFALPDEQMPTLVVGDGQELSWSVLADAAPYLATLLDRRMRSLETLMLRLAHRSVSQDPRQRPTHDELARALNCKVELVREHALALRTDGDMLMGRLLPVVACAIDVPTAHALGERLGETALRSAVLEALAPIASRLPLPPEELLAVLARPDLAEIRRTLGLDYAQLNRMLAALGQPTLSNEGELRRLFETWKSELTATAVDRLRRHFLPAFATGTPLDRYVELRTLEFLEFQDAWIEEREELSVNDVRALLDARLTALVGVDVERDLEPLAALRSRSRRLLQQFLDAAAPTVGAWRHREGRANPWAEGGIAVLRTVDQRGLLDFSPIGAGAEIATLVRAGVWPEGMLHTADPVDLGLDPDDLLCEKKREEERREKAETARRTITFASNPLDTKAKDFAGSLVALADAQMLDGIWLKRSRSRFNLAEQAEHTRESGPGGKGGKRRRPERVSENVKSAMGFASEYLASRFLREKHKERYDDRCWVSENRGLLEIDCEGDDRLGFDFRVQTVETEWRYEVKSNLDDSFEFEFTQNEMRSAAECAADLSRRYRILYVPFVFDPSKWRVMELPNPMSERGRRLFKAIGAGATRFRFDPS